MQSSTRYGEIDYYELSKDIYILSVCIYLFCLPLNTININGMGSVLKFIAIIPVGVSFICSGGRIKYNKLLSYQTLFTLFAAASIIWSIESDMSIDRTITYVLLTLLLYSSNVFEYDAYDIERIKRALLWSSRTTAIVMIAFSEFTEGRFFLRGIISEDPNYLCGYLMAGIIIIINNLYEKEKKLPRIIELLIYTVLIIGTGSRGGLIAAVAAVIVYLFSSKRTKKRKKRYKIAVVTIIVVLIIVSFRFLPQEILGRFNLMLIIARGGTGRIDIWTTAINIFKESVFWRKLFGQGTGTIASILLVFENNKYHYYVAHNIFLETLVELGVIGLIIYVGNVIKFVKASFSIKDKFAFSVLIGMIVLSLSTSLHTFKPYFNIMLYILMVNAYERQRRIKDTAE